jgi:hypothetical protein
MVCCCAEVLHCPRPQDWSHLQQVQQAQQQLAALQLPPPPPSTPRGLTWDPAAEVNSLAAYLAAAGTQQLVQQLPQVMAQQGMTVEKLVAAALMELFKGRLSAQGEQEGHCLQAPCVTDVPPAQLAPSIPARAVAETPVSAAAAAGSVAGTASYKAALLAKQGQAGGQRVLQLPSRRVATEAISDRQLAAMRENRLRYGSSLSGAAGPGSSVSAGLQGLEQGVAQLQTMLQGMAALAGKLPLLPPP